MADRNKWKSMSSSRFGIYREATRKPRTSSARRCCCSLLVLLVIVVVIGLTALSITTGKGRKKMKAVVDEREEGKARVNVTQVSAEEEPAPNATEMSQSVVEPSLPRPDISGGLQIDEDLVERSTLTYSPEQTEPAPPGSDDPSFASRQGRIMNGPVVSPYKLRSPPRFLHQPEGSRNVVFPDFNEKNFAQMGGYTNNRYEGSRRPQEVLDFAANERPSVYTKVPAIKFTGVYVRGPANEIENFSLSSNPNTHLNGHAYSPQLDPFKAYKPSHPSEINHLATTTSEFDTGPRFSNKIVRATIPTPEEDSGAAGSGSSITQAIFHPYGEPGVIHPELPTLPPPPGSQHQHLPDKKGRPLKIMLDIYPLNQHEMSNHGSNVEHERQRKPPVPAVVMRPVAPPPPVPAVVMRPVAPPPPVPPPTQPNRMIVHLNLFPKKSPRNSQRRTTPPTPMTLVPGGGSQFEDRISSSQDQIGSPSTFKRHDRIRWNGTQSDQSIEIAETYPVSAADLRAEGMVKGALPAFSGDDQAMAPDSHYDFTIGPVRPEEQDEEDERLEGEGEDEHHGHGEVYVFEEGNSEEESHDFEDDGERRGKSKFRDEDEESRDGFKVVSFQVMTGGDGLIDDGTILRASTGPDNSGGETDGHQPVGGLDYGRVVTEDARGIRMKPIGRHRHSDAFHSLDDEVTDDGVPIGTVSEAGPTLTELDLVPGIIEPRVDYDYKSWWPRSASLVDQSTAPSVSFPDVLVDSTDVSAESTAESFATHTVFPTTTPSVQTNATTDRISRPIDVTDSTA